MSAVHRVPPGVRRLVLACLMIVPLMSAVIVPVTTVAQDGPVVTMVTDTAGLGDQNFNDLAKRGLDRAAAELGIQPEVIESQEAADYVPNLTQAAEQSDLTVGVGFLLTDAITAVASQYPDDKFLLIDSAPTEEVSNVTSALFREHEGGFLGGVVAGLMTQTGKVGILGGQDIPPVERYEVGFRAGILSVAPEVEVAVTYTDTFGDPALGKEQSLALYSQDNDIIFPIAGATGIGTFEAAKERENAFVIAADADQSHLGPEQQLCAVTKGVDTAVFTASQQIVDDAFEGGVLDLGLANDGMGLVTPGDYVPADVLAMVDQYRQAIADGSLTVPATRAELETFEPMAVGSPTASPEASPAA